MINQKYLQIRPLWGHDNTKPGKMLQNLSRVPLTQLENGAVARVAEVHGEPMEVDKLEAMGIIPGAIIVKKTASLMKGPIVVEKGETQFAIGYGMAQEIITEPIDKNAD